MKIAYTLAASAFITGFNQSAVGLGDSDFPRRNLPSNNEFLEDTSFPRFSDALQNKILHRAFPHQNEFLSKITSAYDKSRQTEKVEVVRQTQDVCTLCAYGETLPDPARIFSLGSGETFTCGLFEEIAAELEDCAQVQAIGHTYCGCSSPPEGICTFCVDGESIPDPYKNVTIGGGMYYTCGELSLSIIYNDPDTCFPVQQFGYINCGCSSPPEISNVCPLCVDGQSLPDPNNTVDIFGSTYTCGELELIFSNEEEICRTAQFIGHFKCGCSSAPPGGDCTLCADGESVPDPNKIPFEEIFTCGQLEVIASGAEDEECFSVQEYGYTSCDCSSPPESSCTLCGDGSQVSPEFLDKVIDGGFTCAQTQEFAKNVPETFCSQIQFQGFAECGCPTGPDPVENSCSVCPEGFEPDLDLVVPEFDNKKCEEFVEPVSGISSDSDYCYEQIHTFAVTIGCCTGEKRCPDDDWKTFIYEGKKRPCSWLNTLSEDMRNDICYYYAEPYEACPFACFGACYCRDKKWNKFDVKSGRKRSCMWLSKLKKKSLKNICKWNKTAKKNCPDTCQGWCYF